MSFGHPVNSGTKGQNAHTPTSSRRGRSGLSPLSSSPLYFCFRQENFNFWAKEDNGIERTAFGERFRLLSFSLASQSQREFVTKSKQAAAAALWMRSQSPPAPAPRSLFLLRMKWQSFCINSTKRSWVKLELGGIITFPIPLNRTGYSKREIQVFYKLFHRSLSIFSMTSLKHYMEYFNFRCKIQLDLPVHREGVIGTHVFVVAVGTRQI